MRADELKELKENATGELKGILEEMENLGLEYSTDNTIPLNKMSEENTIIFKSREDVKKLDIGGEE